MNLALYYAAAFFIGTIPNAYLAGRWLKGIDIRQHGSGNVGATNVFRVLGKGPGYAVFALDFLKGALPAFVSPYFFPGSEHMNALQLSAGLAAVFGHMFNPFLGFKGGKGVATGGGALCAAFPVLFSISTVVWILVFQLTKIVSVGSLAAVSALFIASLFIEPDSMAKGVFAGILVLVFWSHRSNLQRLAKGEENGFSKTK